MAAHFSDAPARPGGLYHAAPAHHAIEIVGENARLRATLTFIAVIAMRAR